MKATRKHAQRLLIHSNPRSKISSKYSSPPIRQDMTRNITVQTKEISFRDR
jgi:hypothetical protein